MNHHKDNFEMIPIGLLVYSGRNPRQEMRGIEDLADNIKQYGIIEPITVRPKESKFEIVVGERRVRAATIAGVKDVPARVRDINDRTADELRLIENIHREDLTYPEKGDAVISLLENYPEKYPTLKAVAEALNISYATVRKKWCPYARKLSPFVKQGLEFETLSEYAVGYLLKYDHETQDVLTETMMRHKLRGEAARKFLKLFGANKDANLDELAEEAKGTKKVRIPLELLSMEAREEVEQVLQRKKEQSPRSDEVKNKIRESLRETAEIKSKAKAEKIVVPAEIAEQLTKEVQKQIKETVSKAPEKVERITDIVDEGMRGLEKRLGIFPGKSQKIQPKFDKFRILLERGVIPYTVWDFPDRDYAGDKDFHGNCSPQIVEQCIWRLTEEGDLVVDPMAGSGTALDVCREFNRKCIGYDIKPPPDRGDIIQNDSRGIPLENGFVDMIFIHPPYWNLTYFTKAEERLPDLSRTATAEQFLEMLKEVFQECYRVLKHGRFMCVLLGDLIREGSFIPLCRRAANLAEEVGFVDCGYAVKLAHGELSRKKSGVIVAEPIYSDNLKISHDLVMFFRKGGEK